MNENDVRLAERIKQCEQQLDFSATWEWAQMYGLVPKNAKPGGLVYNMFFRGFALSVYNYQLRKYDERG